MTIPMLWTCLLLPSLPLDVFARAQAPDPQGRPFAVTTGGHYPRIVAANAAARATGIREGQLVAASLALAPDLVMRDRDPGAEGTALEAVGAWATQFTPAVSLARPDAVLAEIGGSLRLFGGLPKLALPVAIPRRRGLEHESVTRLLAHLFEHQIHHRGQAHAMLAGTAVKPPQLDEFFCANEAHLRAAELAEIGLSEEAVWGAAPVAAS